MELVEAIRARKSIRAYKPDPVPKDVIRQILEVARRAPSAMNTQPWEFTVVSGEVLEAIRRDNIARLEAGTPPQMEVARGPYADRYRERQTALGRQLFELLGISREDREKRREWTKQGFAFFGAPVAIIITTDRDMTASAQFDLGAVTLAIALLALEHGLGTCIMGQGIMYPDVVRQHTGIPESKTISICLTLGYPDWSHPANQLQSERDPLDSITTWCGF